MGIKLSAFMTDQKLENEGRWFKFEQGVEFLIGRIGSTEYQAAMAEVISERVDAYRADTVTAEQKEQDMHRIMAKSILLGWTGLDGEDGQPLGYSFEVAEKILRESSDIRNFVRIKAADRANFHIQFRESSQGN